MARKAMDTSAVLKLYRAEPNSPAVLACLERGDELLISALVTIEVISAAYGLVRQKIATKAEADILIAAFEADKANFTILPCEDTTLLEAERLLSRYAALLSLRPMDALQLATALVEHRRNPLDAFVTTDKVLISVATSEGLIVKP